MRAEVHELELIARATAYVAKVGKYQSPAHPSLEAAMASAEDMARRLNRGAALYARAEQHGLMVGALYGVYRLGRGWEFAG